MLPEKSGVYIFLNKKGKILYVGKAKNLKARVSSYFNNRIIFGEKTRLLVSQTEKIKIIITFSEIESLLLEANLIKKSKPLFNIKLTDGKTYPSIRITIKDQYPAVLIARKQDDNQSIYFGPFPNGKAMRLVLKILRKIFPFHSLVNHPKRICLYNHLGLCPCLPVFNSPRLKKAYNLNIRRMVSFLKGDVKKVVKELEKERDFWSIKEQYEKASKIQNKINSIKLVTASFHSPIEYELNPNLRDDLREQKIADLKQSLNNNGIKILSLNRIECYDISNISGKHATGSMVVFIKGEKTKSLYRRFKIIFKSNVNDFLMIKEIISRRLKHKEWEYPDLIIVDGGKGQVSFGVQALNENYLKIPIIGIAKKNEIIITSDFREIILPKNSNTLLFLKSIRDEAHRFAIAYHRKLRSKLTFV